RADLTEQRLYTVSDATRRVVGGLTDPLRVRAYWGTEIPSSALPVRRRLEGLLDEYAAAGNGRIDVQWVEMNDDGRREAGEKGIPETGFHVREGQKLSVSQAYNGLALMYEDRVEVVGPLAEMSDNASIQLRNDLEYVVTSAVYKLSRARGSVVGVVSDAQPMNFMNPQGGDRFAALGGHLEDVYGNDLRRSVSLDEPVATDIAVLLVIAPKDWPEKKVWHLEQFLLRGGKVLLLHDAADVRVAWSGQPPTRSGLEDWLRSQGVEVLPGVVAEFDPRAMCRAMTQARELIPYPYWPLLRATSIDQDCPGTRGMDGIPLYWASEIAVDAAAQKTAGRTYTLLASTTDQGWRKDTTDGLTGVERPDGKPLGKRAVMVSLQGTFTSFWKGKPVPGETPPASPGPVVPIEPGMNGESAPAMSDPPPTPEPAMGEPAMDDPAMGEEPKAPPEPAMEGAPEKAPEAPEGGPKGPEGAPGEPGASPAPPAAGPARLDEGKGVLVILGDADTVSNDFSGTRGDITSGATAYFNRVGGFSFVPSVIDWLSGSDELIALRARGAVTRKLEEIDAGAAGRVKLWNYLLAPLAVLVAGLFVYFVRRYRS
ncbi:MAG TPA: Gldg family protein, partial [Planctomycetota bacterium]|nr:Gldg family protein [Planctomycetota bacterium]